MPIQPYGKKQVNFVVTDLDDTIWNWLLMWHNSFKPYLERISKKFNIDIELLKNDFKDLHRKYGTAEASFIFNELKCLSEEQKKEIEKESIFEKSIIHEFYSNKKNNLILYEGVLDTLKELKAKGVKIVAFTESHAFYTKYRIKHLELDGIIDCVYSPVDLFDRDSVKTYYPPEHWEPQVTMFRYLAREVRKPNKEILEIILKDFNAKKENTIYIGDKLDRDIYMAQQADITGVYAKYGHLINAPEYGLLVEVTHWTDEDVEREKRFKDEIGKTIPEPDVTLETSFNELFKHFSFYRFDDITGEKHLDSSIEVWKKVVDVQQHFNDLELRIRNFALTVFTAIFAGIALLEREKIKVNLWDKDLHASSILCLIGVIVLSAFFYMDKYWYHNLLLGAVKQGEFIEKRYANDFPEIMLGHSIRKSSPHPFLWKWEISSKGKYWFFYSPLFLSLIILGLALSYNDFKSNKPQNTQPDASKLKATSPFSLRDSGSYFQPRSISKDSMK